MAVNETNDKFYKLLDSENFIYELRTNPDLLDEFYMHALNSTSNDIDFLDKAYSYISTVDERMANSLIMNVDEGLLKTWIYNTDILSTLPSTQVYFYRRLGKQIVPMIHSLTTQPFIKEVIVNEDRETYNLLMKRRDIINKFDKELLKIAFKSDWASKLFRTFSNLTPLGKLATVLAFILTILILIDLMI